MKWIVTKATKSNLRQHKQNVNSSIYCLWDLKRTGDKKEL